MPDSLILEGLRKAMGHLGRDVSLPPMGGIPQALDATGLLHIEPSLVAQDEHRKDEVVNPDDGDVLHRLAALSGFAPRLGERLGDFWTRQVPNTALPSWKEKEGQDVQIPPAKRR